MRFHALVAGSASLLAITAAYAADPDSANSSGSQMAQAAPNQGLEEVTVTATRRSEKLLSVPITIQTETALQIQKEGLKYISDLTFTTPGFIPENGTGYTQIYIRGIGNQIFVGADPSVVTYIDDVPRIYGSMVNSFFNVDRIEVLKGAQGGLYGRNATGGVVNIITKQPSDELNGDVRVGYGTFNTGDVAAYVNIPLTDNIYWNISAQRDWHDPYVKNLVGPDPLTAANFPKGAYGMSPTQTAAAFNSWINPSKGYGNQDFYAGDTKLTINVSENFKIMLDADFARKRDSDGNQWSSVTPAANAAYAAGLFGAFGIPFVATPGLYVLPGKWQLQESDASSAALRDYGGSVKMIYSFPGFDLENIYAYRAQQTLYEQGYADPITLIVPIVRNRKNFQNEELRAVSTGDGPWHWIAGVTYLEDYFHGLTNTLILPPLYTIPVLKPSVDTLTQANTWVHNYSVYGDVTYDITSKVSVEGSLRYVNEKNTTEFSLPQPPSADFATEGRLLPAGTLSYKLEDGGNVYLRYAEGWKAGGVNVVVPPNLFPSSNGVVFAPETVDTYEVGMKDSLFGGKGQFTTDLFWNDDHNLQIAGSGNPQHPAIIYAVVNAESARTYGWEGTFNYRVIPELTVGLDVGYLEAEYLNFSNTDCSVLSCYNRSHTRMLWAPKWQGGITLDYDQPLNDHYRLVGSWLTSFVGSAIGDFSNTPGPDGPYIPGYAVTNVRLGVHTTDDKYAFTVYAKNLFDKRYGIFDGGPGGAGGKLYVLGDRRIIGGELEYKF